MNKILIIGVVSLAIIMIIAFIIANENHRLNYNTMNHNIKPYAECNGVYVSCIYHDTQEILERLDRIEMRLNQTN